MADVSADGNASNVDGRLSKKIDDEFIDKDAKSTIVSKVARALQNFHADGCRVQFAVRSIGAWA